MSWNADGIDGLERKVAALTKRVAALEEEAKLPPRYVPPPIFGPRPQRLGIDKEEWNDYMKTLEENPDRFLGLDDTTKLNVSIKDYVTPIITSNIVQSEATEMEPIQRGFESGIEAAISVIESNFLELIKSLRKLK